MDTHFPFMPPNSDFTSGEQLYLNYLMTRNRIADLTITPPEQRSLLKLYREEITYLDSELERLFNKLKARGELSKTLIIFTGDHGELLGEFGKFGHKSARLGSPLTHVPLLIWGDDIPDKTIRSPVSLVDIVPTIYDYIGISPQDGLDGHSLRPVIESGEQPKTPAISELGHHPFAYSGPPSKDTTTISVETDNGLIVGDWLNNNPPSEQLSEYEILRERREELNVEHETYSDNNDIDSATKQRLQDIGYLE
jgi:arylsulfatase A-like enzyme